MEERFTFTDDATVLCYLARRPHAEIVEFGPEVMRRAAAYIRRLEERLAKAEGRQ